MSDLSKLITDLKYIIMIQLFSGGITFHSALHLKIGNKLCYMSDKTRAAAKHTLANLKLLIIDEMSLVGADMLYRIHKRLYYFGNE